MSKYCVCINLRIFTKNINDPQYIEDEIIMIKDFNNSLFVTTFDELSGEIQERAYKDVEYYDLTLETEEINE